MLAKAKNGHTNIWYILLLNFVATYNIRSPTQDSEKEIVLCKKGDNITRFDGIYQRYKEISEEKKVQYFAKMIRWDPDPEPP